MTKSRSANITDRAIKKIIGIIDNWSEAKLTWNLLVIAIKEAGLPSYTRQALERHERIKLAYTLRKESIRDRKRNGKEQKTSGETEQDRRIKVLEATVKRLEAENDNLLEQFQRWAYNGNIEGLSLENLNRPLPSVNRGRVVEKDKTVMMPKGFTIVVSEPTKN